MSSSSVRFRFDFGSYLSSVCFDLGSYFPYVFVFGLTSGRLWLVFGSSSVWPRFENSSLEKIGLNKAITVAQFLDSTIRITFG